MSKSALERASDLLREHDQITSIYGSDRNTYPPGQREHINRIETALKRTEGDIESEATRSMRSASIADAARNPANVESGDGPAGSPDSSYARSVNASLGSMSRYGDPYQGLGLDVSRSDTVAGLISRGHDVLARMDESVPQAGREKLARMMESDDSAEAASFVICASDPAYLSAFSKGISSPYGFRAWDDDELAAFQRVDVLRAAMGEGGTAAYLVPTPLDPNIVVTNAGIVNPIRQYARIETTMSSTWNGAASAGATAYVTAENVALTEANPVFAKLTVTPEKLTTWITGSYELEMDALVASQLPVLISDAFNRLEGDLFVNGSGGTKGVITAVSATAGSTVTATTRGSFTTASVVDLYAIDNALPARARSNGPVWLAARATINTIRGMSAAANGSSFWASMGDQTPPTLLDHRLAEASSLSAATTSGSINLILADLSQYLVVDRAGSFIEYVQNAVSADGIPTGTRGWIGWKRVGATLTNLDAVRFLKC